MSQLRLERAIHLHVQVTSVITAANFLAYTPTPHTSELPRTQGVTPSIRFNPLPHVSQLNYTFNMYLEPSRDRPIPQLNIAQSVSRQWFFYQQDRHIGPLTEAEFEEKLVDGTIGPADYYWTQGMNAWESVRELQRRRHQQRAPAAPPYVTGDLSASSYYSRRRAARLASQPHSLKRSLRTKFVTYALSPLLMGAGLILTGTLAKKWPSSPPAQPPQLQAAAQSELEDLNQGINTAEELLNQTNQKFEEFYEKGKLSKTSFASDWRAFDQSWNPIYSQLRSVIENPKISGENPSLYPHLRQSYLDFLQVLLTLHEDHGIYLKAVDAARPKKTALTLAEAEAQAQGLVNQVKADLAHARRALKYSDPRE